MYLRTTTRRNADGSVVRYYQLAENVWDPARRCAVAKVIYHFGRGNEVDRAKMERLARSILRVFGGDERPAEADGATVLDARPYGAIYALDALWRELGIDALVNAELRAAKVKQPFERALFAMVANRALRPYSKLYTWEQWLRDEVFLAGSEALALQHFYRAMDFLEAHKAALEKALYFRMADLMNADVDLIFYDTTSLHFEIDEEDDQDLRKDGRRYEAQRQRGHAKNGRDDAPQIVVGLAVTREGLPVRSWVFAGNTADVTTVEQVKADLKGWKLGRCVFVGDAGMNSEENRRTLGLGGGKYILATRMRADGEVTHDVLTRAGRYKDVRDNLRIKEVVVGDGARRRRYVVCHNPAEAERQSTHRDKLVAVLEQELAALQSAGDAHSKKACELLTSARFGRYLRQTATGKVRLDRAAITEAARYDGKWVITSNDDTLSAEDLALGYKQLMRVESCWRTLKSGLRLRPVYHWRPWRIQAHVSLAVLALLLERIAEIRTGETWRNVRATLERIQVVEYVREGTHIRQTTEVRAAASDLLRKLKVPAPPKLHLVQEAADPTSA
jgi:hypothetical protein